MEYNRFILHIYLLYWMWWYCTLCLLSIETKRFWAKPKEKNERKKNILVRCVRVCLCPCVVNDKRIQCYFHFISFIRNQAIRCLFVHSLTVCVPLPYTSSFYSWFHDAAAYTATDFIIISFNSFHVRWTFFFVFHPLWLRPLWQTVWIHISSSLRLFFFLSIGN